MHVHACMHVKHVCLEKNGYNHWLENGDPTVAFTRWAWASWTLQRARSVLCSACVNQGSSHVVHETHAVSSLLVPESFNRCLLQSKVYGFPVVTSINMYVHAQTLCKCMQCTRKCWSASILLRNQNWVHGVGLFWFSVTFLECKKVLFASWINKHSTCS